jgi:hypothetical protein
VAERTYLERYLAGEYEQVWDELVGLGAAVRTPPASISPEQVTKHATSSVEPGYPFRGAAVRRGPPPRGLRQRGRGL